MKPGRERFSSTKMTEEVVLGNNKEEFEVKVCNVYRGDDGYLRLPTGRHTTRAEKSNRARWCQAKVKLLFGNKGRPFICKNIIGVLTIWQVLDVEQ